MNLLLPFPTNTALQAIRDACQVHLQAVELRHGDSHTTTGDNHRLQLHWSHLAQRYKKGSGK